MLNARELARDRIVLIGVRMSMGTRGGSDEEQVEEIVRNVLVDYTEFGTGRPLEALVAEARGWRAPREVFKREQDR